MMKKLIWVFIFCLGSILGSKSYASALLLSHDQYLAMNNEQKEELIIKTMELIVNLESQYELTVKAHGFNLERYRHYTRLLNQLQGLLISSAHAADPNKSSSKKVVNNWKWEDYGNNFKDQFSSVGDGNKCVYGGWPSRFENSTMGKRCKHPSYLKKDTPEYKAYTESNNTVCNPYGSNPQITCNPAIFGFKNENDKSLFCVSAGMTNQEIVSLSCMRASLGKTGYKGQTQGSDTPKLRLEHMKKHLEENPKIFDGVQKFIYRTCVCDPAPESINKDYVAKIKHHPTCYGLMRAVGDTASQCQTVSEQDLTPYKNISKKLELNLYLAKDNEYLKHYDKFLKENKDDKICLGGAPVVAKSEEKQKEAVISCEMSCLPYEKNKNRKCDKLVAKNEKGEVLKEGSDFTYPDNYLSWPEDSKEFPILVGDKKQQVNCKIVPPKPSCEISCAPYKEGVERKCDEIVVKNEKLELLKEGKDGYTMPGMDEVPESAKDFKITIGSGKNKKEVTCIINDKSEEKYECKLAFTVANDKKVKVSASITPEVKDVVYTWGMPESKDTGAEAVWTPDNNIGFKASATAKFNNQEVVCAEEFKYEDDEDGDAPELKVKIVKDSFTVLTLEATLDDKKEKKNGYSVIWVRDEAGKKLFDDSKADKKGAKAGPIPGTVADKEEEKKDDKDHKKEEKKEDKKDEVPSDATEDFTFAAAKMTAEYKVCAKLVKNKKLTGQEKCETVKKLGDTNATPGAPNYIPPGNVRLPQLNPPMKFNTDRRSLGVQ